MDGVTEPGVIHFMEEWAMAEGWVGWGIVAEEDGSSNPRVDPKHIVNADGMCWLESNRNSRLLFCRVSHGQHRSFRFVMRILLQRMTRRNRCPSRVCCRHVCMLCSCLDYHLRPTMPIERLMFQARPIFNNGRETGNLLHPYVVDWLDLKSVSFPPTHGANIGMVEFCF